MKRTFISLLSLPALVLFVAGSTYAQADKNAKPDETQKGATGPAISASTSPADLARIALAAQGGDKFKTLKNVVMRGSVNLYAPNSANSLPGQFVIATAGDKVRIEVAAPPLFAFKQIFDGERSYSSLPNMELPPLTKFGINALAKYEQPGYTVTGIPDKDKRRGFRITDADGNATDFYLEPATGRVKSFLIPYNGRTFGTENDKMKEVEGVLIAFKFTMRLATIQGVYFAEYSVKDVKLNQPLGDDVFEIPN